MKNEIQMNADSEHHRARLVKSLTKIQKHRKFINLILGIKRKETKIIF